MTAGEVHQMKPDVSYIPGWGRCKHRIRTVRALMAAPPFPHDLFPPILVPTLIAIFGVYLLQFPFQPLLAEFA